MALSTFELIVTELRRQENDYINGPAYPGLNYFGCDNPRDAVIDGHVDLVALADAVDKHVEALRLFEENERLKNALRMVLENIGGHHHWDSFGTAGANCPICKQQTEAQLQAWELLRNLERRPG